MMSAITFDTLAYAKKLKNAGVSEAQAEVQAESLAEIIEDNLATKRDIKELEINLQRDLKEMELRLTHALTLRLGSMLIVGIGVVATLVKLL